jgi:hypothetical protein
MNRFVVVMLMFFLIAAAAHAETMLQPSFVLGQCNLPNNGGLMVWAWTGTDDTKTPEIDGVDWSLDGVSQGRVDFPAFTSIPWTEHLVYLPVTETSGRITLSCYIDGANICTSPKPGVTIMGSGQDTSMNLNAAAPNCTQKQLDDYYKVNPPPVPEFGVIAASIAMIGAIAGIILFRKH